VALAIGGKVEYVKVSQGDKKFILAKKRLEILEGEYEILGDVAVSELVGKSYKPLFNYLNPDKKAYFIAEADFASDEEGTGIVHTAVMYGALDFELGRKLDLPMKHLVNLRGEFIPEVTEFAGKFVKDADDDVIASLEKKGLMYKSGKVLHTYPFCWRCQTPILYYALTSWFIKTTAVKEALLNDNDQINWVPETIKNGRMRNWLETLVDWNISRNRFWGTPLPVWQCVNKHVVVIGSKAELEDKTGKQIEDLHRPFIDELEFECTDCHETMKRIPEVMDVWMDSGAMPFAQWHYPFENKEIFEEWYPADYIVEGIDQTRGWFFTLMAEAMLLGHKSPGPFKNVVTTGFVLDDKGQKMSKSKGNVVDPWDVIPLVGADTLRWYICAADPTGNILMSKDLLQEKMRKFTLILWNSYKFFLDYATATGWQCEMERGEMQLVDRWSLAKLTDLVQKVNLAMDEYRIADAARMIESYVSEDLSTWYIRRNRSRVGMDATDTDRNIVMSILFGNLVTLTKLLAPFMPFLAEEMYRNLTGGDVSVHLQDYPKGDASLLDVELIKGMKVVRDVVEKGHKSRQEAALKLRQPLKSATYYGALELEEGLAEIVKDELNVKEVHYGGSEGELRVELDTNLTEELRAEGAFRELVRQIQTMRKELGLKLQDSIDVIEAPDWPEDFEKEILEKVSAKSIVKGDILKLVIN
jgi:isoleucyl-tRNA synthetase